MCETPERMDDLRRWISAAVLGLVLAACGSGGDGSDAAGNDGGSDSKIEMANFAFSPALLTIPVGSSVTWKNTDGATHTTTSRDELWQSGRLGTGEEFSVVFDEAGEFTFFCRIHPSMTGTITVES